MILSANCRLLQTLSCYESNWHTCHVVFLVIVQLFAKHSSIAQLFFQHTVTLYSYLAKYISIVQIFWQPQFHCTVVSQIKSHCTIILPNTVPLHRYFTNYIFVLQLFLQTQYISIRHYSYIVQLCQTLFHCKVILPIIFPLDRLFC